MTRVDVQIEQALAFGRSLEWIIEHLQVAPAQVDKALRRMDAACGIDADDEPPPPRTTSTRSARCESQPVVTVDIEDRPLSSFYGPADPDVIRELIAALFPPRPLVVRPCGTYAAFRAHQRRGESVDRDCLLAYEIQNRKGAA